MLDRESMLKLSRAAGFGMTMGLMMLICGGMGVLLDRKLGTAPVFTSLLFLGGGGTALWYAIFNFPK